MKQQFRLFVVTIIFTASVLYLLKDQKACVQNQLYSGLLGNVLATLFAAFMVWVAWEQWSKISQTSSADFIHRLNKDFFTNEARIIIALLDCTALKFVPSFTLSNSEISSDGVYNSQPYFKVDSDALNKSHLPEEVISLLSAKQYYSAWEMDDYLLSPLEDVGMLESRGIVSFYMVYSGFSYYIGQVFNNIEIRKYINSMRKDSNPKTNNPELYFYGFLQQIACKCQEYDELNSGLCKWWWSAKQFICAKRKLPLTLDVN